MRLPFFYPRWETEGKAACLKCAAANFNKLEKNCTMKVLTKKCTDGPPSPGPSPSPHPPPPGPPDPPAPPPTPPVPPNPGAMQPHILLHVTDDQGWANIGFNNEGNVLTPHADKLAAEGIILSRQYTFRSVQALVIFRAVFFPKRLAFTCYSRHHIHGVHCTLIGGMRVPACLRLQAPPSTHTQKVPPFSFCVLTCDNNYKNAQINSEQCPRHHCVEVVCAYAISLDDGPASLPRPPKHRPRRPWLQHDCCQAEASWLCKPPSWKMAFRRDIGMDDACWTRL